jgi:hypothetical protein
VAGGHAHLADEVGLTLADVAGEFGVDLRLGLKGAAAQSKQRQHRDESSFHAHRYSGGGGNFKWLGGGAARAREGRSLWRLYAPARAFASRLDAVLRKCPPDAQGDVRVMDAVLLLLGAGGFLLLAGYVVLCERI